MYDMPFIPPTEAEQAEVKRIKHLDSIISDLEERVQALSEQLNYMDAQVYNLSTEVNARGPDGLGDAYDIPDGRLPC